jgi:hypothetical protein
MGQFVASMRREMDVPEQVVIAHGMSGTGEARGTPSPRTLTWMPPPGRVHSEGQFWALERAAGGTGSDARALLQPGHFVGAARHGYVGGLLVRRADLDGARPAAGRRHRWLGKALP